MTAQAQIELKNIHITGINTALRAQGLKHFIFGGGKLGASIHIPIVRDVSLSIRSGERVGIIGRNGSGKSSILKAIAGIYPPQKGSAFVQGRVAPLIEMSVGFDQELTGRQNIIVGLVYAGRVLEYSKALEEEIIAFTELGSNIDRPIKGYSSGMMGRLCFAVSVFQQPDILLLDEAFAGGDGLFVEKARRVMINKFHSVPIAVLVTHELNLIEKFCNRCIWMHHGQIKEDGAPQEIIANYERYIEQTAQ